MVELQIKAESLPERCEICHKTDCFDPGRNYCSRCSGVSDLLMLHTTALEIQRRLLSMRTSFVGLNTSTSTWIVERDSWLYVPSRVFRAMFLTFMFLGAGFGAFAGLMTKGVTGLILGILLLGSYGAIVGVVSGVFFGVFVALFMSFVKLMRWVAGRSNKQIDL
jgi:hypothetical protein